MHCGKIAGFWGRAKDMFEDFFFECPGAAPRRQDVPIRHKDGGEHAIVSAERSRRTRSLSLTP